MRRLHTGQFRVFERGKGIFSFLYLNFSFLIVLVKI